MQRRAVVLRDYAGLDEMQAATAMALSAGRVESCLGSAREALAATVPPAEHRMNSPEATALLERTADEVVVLAPPVDAMLAEADRARRRRRVTIGGAVLAVLATLGIADGVTSLLDRGPEAWPTSAPPDGMRFVGLGRAVIAVPTGWATDATRCGQPVRDTVVLGDGPADPCGSARPADVRSVAITSGLPDRFVVATEYESGDARCSAAPPAVRPGPARPWCTCRPRTSRSRSRRRTPVLSWPGRRWPRSRAASGCWRAGSRCPRPGMLATDYGRSAEAKYVSDLRGFGLEPVVRTDTATGAEPGTVTGVTPPPGTPLEPGQEVTVTVADGARTPQDEVAVGLGTVDAEHTYRD